MMAAFVKYIPAAVQKAAAVHDEELLLKLNFEFVAF